MNKLFISLIFILGLPLSTVAQESEEIDAITAQELQSNFAVDNMEAYGVEVAKVIITPSELCSQSYTIGFFNGMMNTEEDAKVNRDAVRGLYALRYRNVALNYELFYNQTENIALDISEVFAQRSAEIEGAYDLSKHYNFITDLIEDSERNSDLKELIKIYPELKATFDALKQSMLDKSTEVLKPPTDTSKEDYEKHTALIDIIYKKNDKLLMVAHSQGNLFANYSYKYIKSNHKYSTDNAKIIRVAPASTRKASADLGITNDRYMLANADIIIGALQIASDEKNQYQPNLMLDGSIVENGIGHSFTNIYLKALSEGVKMFKKLTNEALDEMFEVNMKGLFGSFTATANWESENDIDLYVKEPDDNMVYYKEVTGHAGYMDKDNRTEGVIFRPEKYYANCNKNAGNKIKLGKYVVGYKNFKGAIGATATISISLPSKGVIASSSFTTGPESGFEDASKPTTPINIFQVFIEQAPNGNFIFSVVEI